MKKEELLKALECCLYGYCRDCPFKVCNKNYDRDECKAELMGACEKYLKNEDKE